MPRTLTRQRQREVEDLARALLGQSPRITPYDLADRAKIDFFLARGILRVLARQGQATEFPSGSFGRCDLAAD
jgi:ribosomal protein S25